jgi:hypothetical protein
VYILTFGLAYALFPFVFAFHQYQMARELNESLAASTAPRPNGEKPECRPAAPDRL